MFNLPFSGLQYFQKFQVNIFFLMIISPFSKEFVFFF